MSSRFQKNFSRAAVSLLQRLPDLDMRRRGPRHIPQTGGCVPRWRTASRRGHAACALCAAGSNTIGTESGSGAADGSAAFAGPGWKKRRRSHDADGTVCRIPAHARSLDLRICQLECWLERTEDPDARNQLQERIKLLATMLREARELAVLTERYYDRGYRRNAKYTI